MFTNKFKLSVAISAVLISQVAIAATPDKKGMTLWLDASATKTLFSDKGCETVTAVGSGVKCWKDKSGKNNHVKLAKNSIRPSLNTKALNDKTTIQFSTSGSATDKKHVNATALITDKKGQITANSSYTKFVVFSIDNHSGDKTPKTLGRHNLVSSDSNQTSLWANNGVLNSQHAGTRKGYLTDSKKLPLNKYQTAVTRFSKPDDKKHPDDAIHNILKLNGVRIAENDDDDGGKKGKDHHKSAKTVIGGSGTDGSGNIYFPLVGSIAEVIVYDRALSNKEITTIEQYLAKKWNLPLTQNISFNPKDHKKADGDEQELHAVASSALPVSYESETKGVCKIINKNYVKVLVQTEATCTVTASQKGNKTYPKAKPVKKSFKLNTAGSSNNGGGTSSGGGEKGSGSVSPLPLTGLALLGFLALIRRKLAQK